jgi:hypothetical protein
VERFVRNGTGSAKGLIAMETLNTKVTINELSFQLATHTVYFDSRLDSYGILKSDEVLETFWRDWAAGERSGFKGRRCVTLGKGCKQIL